MLIKKLPTVLGKYKENVLMSKMTWFNVGGIVDILFKPANIEDLASFIKNFNDPINVIGVGSNIIVRDNRIKGAIVKLGRGFNNISYIGNNTIKTGAAVLLSNLAIFAKENYISGLEFFIGIPGSVGGAIAMNAGAYGSDTASVLKTITAIDEYGNIHILKKEDMRYCYRSNNLKGKWIFVEATFSGTKSQALEIEKKMLSYIENRNLAQPIRGKTGGSTFKNPPQHKAWKLIDQAGGRVLSIGGAKVSEKHCNFLLNYNNATASDLENLGNEIISRVKNKFNINLEWEIKFLGE